MVDMGLIGGAVASRRAAADIAKGLVGIRDEALLNQKAIELQRIILSAQSDALAAQSAQFTLLEEKRELEAQLAQMKAWETEKLRYEMVELDHGAIAYMIKADAQRSEPLHCICAACYERGKKSIIQRQSQDRGRGWPYKCPECSAIVMGHYTMTRPTRAAGT